MSHITWINVNEKRVTDDQIKQLEQYVNYSPLSKA
ncbi:hypothetical protein DET55_1567 [Bacillus mycoides]|uniref:Uncharacterized protein n=2 Tax=Bacillus cereus group TaxID=86661 RepID=J9BSM3_BACCE|nr:hypothetical protein IG3_05174 [Bacillus cereus HuA2-1]RBP25767.1 hypothetical protein DET63_10940 [Bacillus sp. DB-2]REF15053.1 hypothetical protein DET55_1567 [Bacillus mycoides]